MPVSKSTKQKRLDKFIAKELKKEQRQEALAKLAQSAFKSDLLRSTRQLGRSKDTKKEQLQRALLEEKLGHIRSDPTVRLYTNTKIGDGNASNDDEDEKPKSKSNKRSLEQTSDTATAANTTSTAAAAVTVVTASGDGARTSVAVVKKRKTKKAANKSMSVLAKIRSESAAANAGSHYSDSDFSSDDDGNTTTNASTSISKITVINPDEDEDEDEDGSNAKSKPKGYSVANEQLQTVSNIEALQQSGVAPSSKPVDWAPLPENVTAAAAEGEESTASVFVVQINRDAAIQEARQQLPVCAEEQSIMEAINLHNVVVICGETGSGKTTQIPQFLYEAGYGHAESKNGGMIGVTQPRRVAAVAMAQRVANELNVSDKVVSHQIRYDATVSSQTKIKFMTDGVLLRELATDFTLSKYSAIIIDEAHERSVNTDILIGLLSRVVKLRANPPKGSSIDSPPLKVIIMSATLRVDDFVKNESLFPTSIPPVLKVEARQYPVTTHFSRRTTHDYLETAFKKVCKIHARLPPGGILIFLTGQNEIVSMCKKLRKRFPQKAAQQVESAEAKNIKGKGKGKGKGKQTSVNKNDQPKNAFLIEEMVDDSDLVPQESDVNSVRDARSGVVEDEDVDLGTSHADDDNAPTDSKVYDDDDDGDMSLSDSDDEDDAEDIGEDEMTPEERALLKDADADTDEPLYVLPLYSLLPATQQMKVFSNPPAGSRLCVVATNVAETSITIPGIRYVVDCGRTKERRHDINTGVQSFAVEWVSQASANQRSGRAGRTGPGHCYRLYSAAMYHDHFDKFAKPEIERVPIEGVVLQMKTIGINNVMGFPFPSKPDRTAMVKAEKMLMYLGALDPHSSSSVSGEKASLQPGAVVPLINSRTMAGMVTELGRLMAVFPVAPRFAKMLIMGQQHGCLPYVIALVAGLSAGDPFIEEAHLGSLKAAIGHDSDAEDAADVDMDDDDDNGRSGRSGKRAKAAKSQAERAAEAAAIERGKQQRRDYYSVLARHSGPSENMSDALRLLTAIGAAEYAAHSSFEGLASFCTSNFLRQKTVEDIRKLRLQLTHLVQLYCSGVDVSMDPRMPPPSKLQMRVIRQVMLSGFIDSVAFRADVVAPQLAEAFAKLSGRKSISKNAGARHVPYITMWSNDSIPNLSGDLTNDHAARAQLMESLVFIHPASSVSQMDTMPECVIYTELAKTSSATFLSEGKVGRVHMKGVTAVNSKWLVSLGKELCKFSKPLVTPAPKWVDEEKKDEMICYVRPEFGPKQWPLPAVKATQKRVGTRWSLTITE